MAVHDDVVAAYFDGYRYAPDAVSQDRGGELLRAPRASQLSAEFRGDFRGLSVGDPTRQRPVRSLRTATRLGIER